MDNQHSNSNIAAKKAWEQMKHLLDEEMPVSNIEQPKNNNRKFRILLLLLLIGSCGIYKLYQSDSLKNELVVNYKNINKSNSFLQKKSNNNSQNESDKINNSKTNITDSIDEKYSEKATNNIKNGNNPLNGENKFPLKRFEVPKESIKVNSPQNSYTGQNKYSKKPGGIKENIVLNTTPKVIKSNNKIEQQKKENDDIATMKSENSASSISNPSIAGSEKNKTKDLNKLTLVTTKPDEIYNTTVNEQAKKTDTISNSNVKIFNTNTSNSNSSKNVLGKARYPIHAGLEWIAFVPFNNNTLFVEGNAKKRPLIALIPSVWINRSIGKKSTIYLSVNPYNQYFLNGKKAVQSGNFSINAVSASNINQQTNPTQLDQNYAVIKIMGVEAALQYAYDINRNWSIGFSLGNTWSNSAIFKETIVKNKTEIIKDSLYGVIRTDKDWQFISRSFATGKLSLTYNSKYYQVGASVLKPLTNPIKTTNGNYANLNLQLFFRWKLY